MAVILAGLSAAGILQAEPKSTAWAFQAVRPTAPPQVKDTDWPLSPLDRFVLAELEAKHLPPSPPADKAILIRRVTFDLIGLPPTPEEIDAFLADRSADAFVKVVDRLLASPHYGERWARHWLDLARFCESQGFERDKIRDHAWPYRDYVIQALNADKSYAQFVREHLAGDVLEPVTPGGIAATGFLVAGPWDEVGATQQGELMRLRVREEELEDMIAAVGQTFLGLTVNCARCHNHKFDPISQRDYYRIKAVFEGVRPGERPLVSPEEAKRREQTIAGLRQMRDKLAKQLAAVEDAARAQVANGASPKETAGLPKPIARWTFDKNARDQLGGLHGTLRGGAVVKNGRLLLNGQGAYVETAPLVADLREKTLEAWVALADLGQRGGGVMTVQTQDGFVFDSIVFGERQPQKWLVGSDFFHRTQDLAGPAESARPGELVHVVAAYEADGRIALYRNGILYGDYRPTGKNATLQTYPVGKSVVLFGLRHTGAGNGFLAGEIEEARLYNRALKSDEVAAVHEAGGVSVPLERALAALPSAERRRHDTLTAQLRDAEATLASLQAGPMAYAINVSQPGPTFVLHRGEVEKKREQVSAGGLAAVKSPSPDFGLAADASESQRRLRFADWLVHPEHPLTARVLVNRVWHYHFGRGLVGTPNDFGVNGEPPSHPHLLDWLAAQFIADGWSIKRLHRRILLSRTYQQASRFNDKAAALDGDNRLLWRFSPRRLEGEAVRDALLAASGQLNRRMAGPSFRPFEVKVFNSHFYELTDPPGPEFNRRTVYRINVNSAKSPLLDSLDCPDPSVKTPRRSVTTTPLQALGMMNNSFVLRQARCFASRVENEYPDSSSRITRIYRLALGRSPTPAEIKRAHALAAEQGLETVCWILLNANEFVYAR